MFRRYGYSTDVPNPGRGLFPLINRGKNRLTAVLLVLVLLFLAVGLCVPGGTQTPTVVQALPIEPTGISSLIISKAPGAVAVEAGAELLGARITARWPFINAFAADMPVQAVRRLAGLPGVRSVVREAGVQAAAVSPVNDLALLNGYNYAVRADNMWTRGYDGTGITVAVVDSGIDPNSPDLSRQTALAVKFSEGAADTRDLFGHGTHVAGVIAGNGTAGGGRYIGIAPGVRLLNVKYSADNGTASERDLINALQWVYDNRTQQNIRIVNLSATVDRPMSYRQSPVAAAVEKLWFAGVVVVVAAGNRGGTECSACYPPANDPYVITVGAVDDAGTKTLSDDYMKSWSSYGLTADGYFKPEVMAPGARIISYMASGTLRDMSPANVVDSQYFRMGGTSVAAPVVSGVAALMLQEDPTLTPDQVKWLLMRTTRSYKLQIPGTQGIVQADSAAFYTEAIGLANQGLTPSPLVSVLTEPVDPANALWSNALWSNALWSNALWSNALWSNALWANALWAYSPDL